VRTDSIEFSQWTTSFVPTGGFKFEVRAPGLMPYDMELNLDQAFLLEPGWTYASLYTIQRIKKIAQYFCSNTKRNEILTQYGGSITQRM
jgi:hypothetical protein